MWVFDEPGVVTEPIVVKGLNRNLNGLRVKTQAKRVTQATWDTARYAKAALVATVVFGLP
jgi:ABC-type sulfate transport system permease component